MFIVVRIIQLLVWLAVGILLLPVLFGRLFLKRAPGSQPRPASPNPVPRRLHRDPWCGIHVSQEISHKLEDAGQIHHFCSVQCRERYRLFRRSAVRA